MENNGIGSIREMISENMRSPELARGLTSPFIHFDNPKKDLVCFLRSVGVEADESESFDDLDKKRLAFIKELDKNP